MKSPGSSLIKTCSKHFTFKSCHADGRMKRRRKTISLFFHTRLRFKANFSRVWSLKADLKTTQLKNSQKHSVQKMIPFLVTSCQQFNSSILKFWDRVSYTPPPSTHCLLFALPTRKLLCLKTVLGRIKMIWL